MDSKVREIEKMLNVAEKEMDYWKEHTTNDKCIFNQSDLWERRYKTLCEVIEILEN